MSDAKIYKQYAYIAGIQLPILSTAISTNLGSLAQMNVVVNYSPFISHLHEFTKIQIWEQWIEDGIPNEPTLEFDGAIVGIQRRRNLLGEVSVSLSCLTDGFIWNIRKQADFYLQDILNADYRGTGNILNMRADGQIFNFFSEVLGHNKFDVGCCVASILTSDIHGKESGEKGDKKKPATTASYYKYTFNGKYFEKVVLKGGSEDDQNANPEYYTYFLKDYHLANKLYGVSTSASVKEFFKEKEFLSLLTNTQNDVYGENTFWQLAMRIAQYGFFNVYDIPNPTFIDTDGGSGAVNVEKLAPSGGKVDATTKPAADKVSVLTPDGENISTEKKSYKGLAEYIFKPVSVMTIPFKCNVIWPDQIVEESVFYDFFNTPTRILYKRSPIPGIEQNVITTAMIVGPQFDSTGYLKDMTPVTDKDKRRDSNVYSEYEEEYGIKYFRLQLNQAFDNVLLNGNIKDASLSNAETALAFGKVKNYLNYEFAQKFLGNRQYTLQVTPDCNPIAGFPVVALNKMGEHVIAFCTGTRKSWSASGQKSVALNVAYPRYYFEDFGDLGNIIDTISQDQNSLDEISTLIGSSPIGKLTTKNKSHVALTGSIVDLYEEYQESKDQSKETKKLYRRKVCTYKQFMDMYKISIPANLASIMPENYSTNVFDSSVRANKFSCHYFEVYDTINKKLEKYSDLSCSEIVTKHLEWIKDPKRI